ESVRKREEVRAEVQRLRREGKIEEMMRVRDMVAAHSVWMQGDNGRLPERLSIIIDPADGRRPPLTANGQKLQAETYASWARRVVDGDVKDFHWTDIAPYIRCIARPIPRIAAGPVGEGLTGSQGGGIQILQT